MVAVAAEEQRERYRDALAVPEFRFVFASYTVTMLGTIVAELATSVMVYSRTSSPLLSTLVIALGFLPYLFAGTLLSSLGDRVPVRGLMVGCNVVTATVACAMSVPGMPVAALLSLVFVLGLVAPVFSGTRAATLPDILPGPAYVPGRSLFRLVSQGAQVTGLAMGGALLAVVSASTALRLEALAFLGSAALLRFGTPYRPAKGRSGGLVGDSLRGVGAVLRVGPVRRILLLSWVIPMIAVIPEALAVPYAHERGLGTVRLGLMMSALPLGNVVGEFLGVWTMTPARQMKLIVPGACIVFVPMLGFAFSPGFWVVVGMLLVSGLGFWHHLGLDHRLVEVAPEGMLARALAVQGPIMMFTQGVGFAGAGAVAQVAPLSVVLAGGALVGLAVVGVLARS